MTRLSTATTQWTHRLFVYGTLKKGLTNYRRYLGVAEECGKAKFVGGARTKESFPMVIRPVSAASKSRAPILMDSVGEGSPISGEVFTVDDSTLEALDILEGVKSNKYYKKQVAVVDDNGSELLCCAYVFPACEELLKLPLIPSYSIDHHALYSPSPLKEDILHRCLPQPAVLERGDALNPRELPTASPTAAREAPSRWSPVQDLQDLLCTLAALAVKHQLGAAAVLTSAGGASQTTMRQLDAMNRDGRRASRRFSKDPLDKK